MKSGLKQVLNCYVVYNLHYMFNIVDYFIDYKYLEDSLKNLNMMKYLWEQDLIHYVLTMPVTEIKEKIGTKFGLWHVLG